MWNGLFKFIDMFVLIITICLALCVYKGFNFGKYTDGVYWVLFVVVMIYWLIWALVRKNRKEKLIEGKLIKEKLIKEYEALKSKTKSVITRETKDSIFINPARDKAFNPARDKALREIMLRFPRADIYKNKFIGLTPFAWTGLTYEEEIYLEDLKDAHLEDMHFLIDKVEFENDFLDGKTIEKLLKLRESDLEGLFNFDIIKYRKKELEESHSNEIGEDRELFMLTANTAEHTYMHPVLMLVLEEMRKEEKMRKEKGWEF